MTQGMDDLLLVLLLSKWFGINLGNHEGLAICPLFETRRDLDLAPEIMNSLFKHPHYSKHLQGRNKEQNVMIGYSDSNKDAGYFEANWGLFKAQDSLAKSSRAEDVQLTIFHGRGGTIARGGGPANKAILAQPQGSVRGRIRITEQGEVIDMQYGHREIAKRHLGQIVHAVITADTGIEDNAVIVDEWRGAMNAIGLKSHSVFRGLVYEHQHFLPYWEQATPIHELSRLRIGSRPSKRKKSTGFDALRAIPWVFSWMQSRVVLPGWFGLGSGVDDFIANEEGRLHLLQDMYQQWSFFRTVIDNAQFALGKADMKIARHYSELVKETEVRKTVFSIIEQEYDLTVSCVLRISGQTGILDNEPILKRSIEKRNPYVDPLNYIQISLLPEYRALDDFESERAEELFRVISLTMNGIASGLKSTG
jgi:phosphoenolpyruvate carboxylase